MEEDFIEALEWLCEEQERRQDISREKQKKAEEFDNIFFAFLYMVIIVAFTFGVAYMFKHR